MRTLIVVTACAAVLALTGVAQAAEISSAGIFGVEFQDRAECVVLNHGNTPVAVTVNIFAGSGVQLATSNCGGPLGPGQFCNVVRNSPPPFENEPVSCSVTAGSTRNLRGAIVIEESPFTGHGPFHLVRSAPLR